MPVGYGPRRLIGSSLLCVCLYLEQHVIPTDGPLPDVAHLRNCNINGDQRKPSQRFYSANSVIAPAQRKERSWSVSDESSCIVTLLIEQLRILYCCCSASVKAAGCHSMSLCFAIAGRSTFNVPPWLACRTVSALVPPTQNLSKRLTASPHMGKRLYAIKIVSSLTRSR